jgi:hypothetical protein
MSSRNLSAVSRNLPCSTATLISEGEQSCTHPTRCLTFSKTRPRRNIAHGNLYPRSIPARRGARRCRSPGLTDRGQGSPVKGRAGDPSDFSYSPKLSSPIIRAQPVRLALHKNPAASAHLVLSTAADELLTSRVSNVCAGPCSCGGEFYVRGDEASMLGGGAHSHPDSCPARAAGLSTSWLRGSPDPFALGLARHLVGQQQVVVGQHFEVQAGEFRVPEKNPQRRL